MNAVRVKVQIVDAGCKLDRRGENDNRCSTPEPFDLTSRRSYLSSEVEGPPAGRGLAVRFGTVLCMGYALFVLTSTDYPHTIGNWAVPLPLGLSYHWIFVATAVPPILASLLIIRASEWPSRLAYAFWALWTVHVLLEAVSAFTAIQPVQSLILHVAPHAALGLLLIVLIKGPADPPLRWLALTLVVIGLLQALVALSQELQVLPLGFDWLIQRWHGGSSNAFLRPTGLTGYPTLLGPLLVTTLPLLVFVFEKWRAWLIFGLIALPVVLLSGIRGSALGMAAGLAVAGVIVATRQGTLLRYGAAVATLALAVAGAAIGASPTVLTSVDNQQRAFDGEVAWALSGAHTWLGVGSGNFAYAGRQLPQYADVKTRIEPAHNWLLLRLAEGGVLDAALSLVLWTGPIVWLLFWGKGLRAAALATAFTALAVSQWFDYEMLYWIGGAVIQVLLLALWLGPDKRSPPDGASERQVRRSVRSPVLG